MSLYSLLAGAMISRKLTSTHALLLSERLLVDAMNNLWFGRVELLHVERGELVLDPRPTTMRDASFALRPTNPKRPPWIAAMSPNGPIGVYREDLESVNRYSGARGFLSRWMGWAKRGWSRRAKSKYVSRAMRFGNPRS